LTGLRLNYGFLEFARHAAADGMRRPTLNKLLIMLTMEKQRVLAEPI
jgi:hypothetical protein